MTIFDPAAEEASLVVKLRAGDAGAFANLVREHHLALVRLARTFVPSEAIAEEVAQETWVAVLGGIASFEERSSFKTWLFRILVNRARTRGKREGREVAFDTTEESHPDEARFSNGYWSSAPRPWVDAELDDKRAVAIVRRELERLPDAQRAVVTLRDVEGLDAKEVCNVLGIQETHQRVLLHRGRVRLRSLLEKELGKP
jgi:RNA polymerase sigma-70 factor (ECF subfamily)